MFSRRNNRRRVGGAIGPSPLTVALIGLAFVIRFTHLAPTISYVDCAYAYYWVSGWFSFSSVYQMVASAIAAGGVLWLVSFLDREARKNWGEALAQGALLFAFAFWLIAVKSYLFPYAAPTEARMLEIVGAAFPVSVQFVEERAPMAETDPGRPKVEFEEHPFGNPAISKRPGEIFLSEYSPTAADMKRLEACVAEQRRALAQWKIDRETLRAWYADELYREKPKRPRDWKEEAMEELEREGE